MENVLMSSPLAEMAKGRFTVYRHAVLIGVLYFAAALLGMYVSRIPGAVNTLWYASGIAVAGLQSRASRDWPLTLGAVAVADLSAGLIAGHGTVFTLFTFAANMSEVAVGGFLLREFCDTRRALTDVRTLLRALLLGSVLPAMVGAVPGAMGMVAQGPDGLIGLSEFSKEGVLVNWETWFQGSWIGSASILPIGLALAARGPAALVAFRHSLRLPAALGLVLLVALLGPGTLPLAYVYVTCALLLMSSLGGFPGAAVGVLFASLVLGAPLATGLMTGTPGTAALGRALLFVPLALILMPPLLLGALLERFQRDVMELSEREKHFRLTYEKAPVMMHSVDTMRRIVDVNDAWLQRLGYEREEVIGRDSTDFLSAESRSRALAVIVPQFLRDGFIRDINYQFLTKTGEVVDIQLSAIWQRDSNGVPKTTLSVLKDVTEARTLTERMAHLAHHDPLTGLPNRVLFKDIVQQACRAADRQANRVAILFMDLDHFKHVNDSLGHAAGDELLQTVALRLTLALRGEGTVCRLGGDEFVLLAPHAQDRAEAADLALRVLAEVAQPDVLKGTPIEVSVSIGIAMYPADGEDPDTLMKHADAAMYRAKREGRGRFDFFSREIDESATARLVLESRIRHGIQNDEFLLYFQPLVDGSTYQPVGFEALARWASPELGLQLPEKFIAIAEETGMIVPLGAKLLRLACQQISAWQGTPFQDLPMAVNVSIVQLNAPHFVETVQQALHDFSIDGARLVIELTESTLMKNPDRVLDILNELKLLGVRIALDDFGIGHSSLGMLHRFPVDTVKIDRSFIQNLERDREGKVMVNTILAMSRSLRMGVVAEGVETHNQAHILSALGCPVLQGFLFAKPAEASHIEAWLQQQLNNRVRTERIPTSS